MGILLIIIWILMFMSLIILHELGHFRAAKKTGVKVEEFWIGIPPKACNLWKDTSGTQFTLNRIPLGGFCAMKGEDPTKPDVFYAKDSFITAKLWKKLIIIVAGVAMNLLTAWVIFTLLFRHGTQPLGISSEPASESYLIPNLVFLQEVGFASGSVGSGVIVQGIEPNSLAETLGLQAGDIILKVNDKEVSIENLSTLLAQVWSITPMEVVGRSADDVEGFAQVRIKHTLTIQNLLWITDISFNCPDEDCKLWISIIPNSTFEVLPIKFWLWWAMLAGLHEIKAERNLTLKALWTLWKGLFSFNGEKTKDAFNSLAGPVGAVKMGELFYQRGGRIAYLAFAGIISLALAIFNLLPIPALDGGRGLGIILQAIFRWKPEKYFQYEGYVNAFFFYLLLLLGVVIIVKDLIVFWGVNVPFVG